MSELASHLSTFFRRRSSLPELSLQNVSNYIDIPKGVIDLQRPSLFSNFKDEIYFCKAFFNHYRRIGIEQFLIFDDRSSDGTDQFLQSQPDCVIIRSSLTYGQKVRFTSLDGRRQVQRAGVAFKSLIPHLFFEGKCVLNVDADEYLLLPGEEYSICDVIDRLEESGHRAMISPLVEFYPRHLSFSCEQCARPTDFMSLVSNNRYFLPAPIVNVSAKGFYKVSGATKSEELFDRFSIKRSKWRPFAPRPKSPKIKIPIIKHGNDAYRIGSHQVSTEVSPEIVLPIAHFVFTSNFFGKVERAVSWKSHSQGASKYRYFQQLLSKMELNGDCLLGPSSRIFSSSLDLLETGLMKWPQSPGPRARA